LPNAAGSIEQFEVFESSNFEPALQGQFPEIRAYSGRGITDKSAILKLSYFTTRCTVHGFQNGSGK
jgi:hypothetical protein